MDINFCIVASLLAVILSSITAIFAILAYCKVVGMEKSTHQVQWMPLDQPSEEKSDDEKPEDREQTVRDQFRKMYPDIELEQV